LLAGKIAMKPERILLPLDLRACPLEIFSLVEGFARRPEVTLILLHVIPQQASAPNRRRHEELALQARRCLERLAGEFVHPIASTLLHVRLGQPAEEILEEARAERVELIILPTRRPSLWSRLVSAWKPGVRRMVSPLAERIIRDSACGVFVASVKSQFDYARKWGLPMRNNDPALDYLQTIPSPNASGMALAKDPLLA
jgi:nucleotide-binding universal stress UspA family protein